MQNSRTSRLGFTLIELLVVVLIIGILSAIAVPQYKQVVTRAKNREAIINLRAIGRAIEMYNLENGPLPEAQSNDFSLLDVTVKDSKNWWYFFYCYDEFKSCSVWANATKELQAGQSDYNLYLDVDHGVMNPDIEVKEFAIHSIEEQPDGTTISNSSIENAGEAMCKRAAGTLRPDKICVVQ